ncbi:hypothetical protein EVAR_94336_1 [Eumeta japonica]|uniref:Uncharacterized protein n=1 Tax=Eumeta variegata TaxID=151549 RepID=A0A4C1TPW2_EUMVA|nr:hypothetical protein EVAR_94336_1 [Eumeta japonica]
MLLGKWFFPQQVSPSTAHPELPRIPLKQGHCFHMERDHCPAGPVKCARLDAVSVFCCDVDDFTLKEGLAATQMRKRYVRVRALSAGFAIRRYIVVGCVYTSQERCTSLLLAWASLWTVSSIYAHYESRLEMHFFQCYSHLTDFPQNRLRASAIVADRCNRPVQCDRTTLGRCSP